MNTATAESATPCTLSGQRIVQIHPSLKCNLSCQHCYSSSGPFIKTELDPAIVCNLVSDAARMGYEVISISGGEPFLYSGLEQVLRHSKSLGLRTTVTTNGYFLRPRWLDEVRDLVDVLAISLDGPRELHDAMRGANGAFDKVCSGVDQLRAYGMNFGFIHTLTYQTWEHMVWLGEFAAAQGARLLQIHPLEMAGRAEEKLPGMRSGEDLLAKAYLLAFAMALTYDGVMNVQLDVLEMEQVAAMPQLIYADELAAGWEDRVPADLLGLIVMEADGTVVPISYGFARQYQICNLREQSLRQSWARFVRNGYIAYRYLCRELFVELTNRNQPLMNWYEQVVARSQVAASTSTALPRAS